MNHKGTEIRRSSAGEEPNSPCLCFSVVKLRTKKMKLVRFNVSPSAVLFSVLRPLSSAYGLLTFVSCLLLPVVPLLAQTNTFPTSGNVGVGTATPAYKLEVNSGAADTIANFTSTAAAYGIRFNDSKAYIGIGNWAVNGLGASDLGIASGSGAALAFGTAAGVERMRIDSVGNVGIGVTNPGTKLDVSGRFTVTYDGVVSWGDGAAFGQMSWDTGLASIYGRVGKALTLGANNTEVIRISTAGNVGIGTTLPEAGNKLDVYTEGSDPSTQIQIRANRTSYGNIRGMLKTYAGGSPATDTFKMSVDTGSIVLDSGGSTDQFILTHSGNVGIGTTSPSQKLSVNGTIQAKEVIVQTGWSDYIFDESYKLKALSEVEAYVKTEKHLPGIPSAKEVAEHGVSMGEMQSKLLAKIEELTLHQIEQEKQLAMLQGENANLRGRISSLERSSQDP
jgi:hypothetical protein